MQIHAVITQKVMKAFRVSHTGLILKSFFFFFFYPENRSKGVTL